MATGNFYISGNHGLNVVLTENEFDLEDTISNIVCELSSKGYSVDAVRNWVDTPRSFDTGLRYAIFNNKTGKNVALLEVCAGYYDHANINIYTGKELEDIVDYGYNVTKDKRDIDRVVKCVELYTDKYLRTAIFSNGETIYEKVKE